MAASDESMGQAEIATTPPAPAIDPVLRKRSRLRSIRVEWIIVVLAYEVGMALSDVQSVLHRGLSGEPPWVRVDVFWFALRSALWYVPMLVVLCMIISSRGIGWGRLGLRRRRWWVTGAESFGLLVGLWAAAYGAGWLVMGQSPGLRRFEAWAAIGGLDAVDRLPM